jgi:hypothetical protein
MEQIMIITDAATDKTFAVATEEDGSLRLFGVDSAGQEWAEWVDQETKGRGTLNSIIPTLGYAMRIEGPKPLTRQLRSRLADLLPKVRDDVRLELVEGRVKASGKKTAEISPSAKYLHRDLVKSIAANRISATGFHNRQNVINYKAKAFFIDRYHASMAYEIKNANAIWDPNLGPSGGWRCPPGTRFGGYITDEWGRNCGLGVTRRIVNAITSVGQGATNFTDRRRGRRKPEGLGPSLRDSARTGAESVDGEYELPELPDEVEGETLTVADVDMELVDLEAGSREARKNRRRTRRGARQERADNFREERRQNSRFYRFLEDFDDLLEYGEIRSNEERDQELAEYRERRGRPAEQRLRDLADRLDLGWGRRDEDEEEQPQQSPRPRGRERSVVDPETGAVTILARSQEPLTAAYSDLREEYSNDPVALRRIRESEKGAETIAESRRKRDQLELDQIEDGSFAAKVSNGEIPPAVDGEIDDDGVSDRTSEIFVITKIQRLREAADRLTESAEEFSENLTRSSLTEKIKNARALYDLDETQRRIANLAEWLERRGIDDVDSVPPDITLGALFDGVKHDMWKQEQDASLFEYTRELGEGITRGLNEPEIYDELIDKLNKRIADLDDRVNNKNEPWNSRVAAQAEKNGLAKVLFETERHKEMSRQGRIRLGEIEAEEAGGLSAAQRQGLKTRRARTREMYDREFEALKTSTRGLAYLSRVITDYEVDQENALAASKEPIYSDFGREASKVDYEEVGRQIERLKALYAEFEAAGVDVHVRPIVADPAIDDEISEAKKLTDFDDLRKEFEKVPEEIETELNIFPDLERAAEFRAEIESEQAQLEHLMREYAESDNPRNTFRQAALYAADSRDVNLDSGRLLNDPGLLLIAEYYDGLARKYQALSDFAQNRDPDSEVDVSPTRDFPNAPVLLEDERGAYERLIPAIESRVEEDAVNAETAAAQSWESRPEPVAANNAAFASLERAARSMEREADLLVERISRIMAGEVLSQNEEAGLWRTVRRFIPEFNAEDLGISVSASLGLEIARLKREAAARLVESMIPYSTIPDMSARELIAARAKFVKRYSDQSRRRRKLLRGYVTDNYGSTRPWLRFDVSDFLDTGATPGDDDWDDQRSQAIYWAESMFTIEEFEGRDGVWFKTGSLNVGYGGDGIEVDGAIFAKDGEDGDWEQVGKFDRTITTDQVSNNSMFLGPSAGFHSDLAQKVRNKGFQGVFNPHTWLWADAAGISRVYVSATTDGPYVWGRVGFRTGAYEFDDIKDALKGALREYERGTEMDGIIRTDLDANMIRYLLHIADIQGGDAWGLPEFIVATSDYYGLDPQELRAREAFVKSWWMSHVPFSSGEIEFSDEYFADMYDIV